MGYVPGLAWVEYNQVSISSWHDHQGAIFSATPCDFTVQRCSYYDVREYNCST
jgi:hypothetical protein